MSEFPLVEDFQRFLESYTHQDSDFVKREVHYYNHNCQSHGIESYVPLYPLFLNPGITAHYIQLGRLVYPALSKIMEIVCNTRHHLSSSFRERLTIPPDILALLGSNPRGGRMPRVIRPDTFLHGKDIHVQEFNVAWPGGITDSDIVRDELERNTLYTRFIEQKRKEGHAIRTHIPCLNQSLLLEELLDAAGTPNPHIALVIPSDHPTFTGEETVLTTLIATYIREQGHSVEMIHPRDTAYSSGRLTSTKSRRQIHAVYRIFEWKHILESPGEYKAILDAYADGKAAVVNSFHSEAIAAKSVLEILHDPRFKRALHAGGLEPLLEFIPYTQNVQSVARLQTFIDEKNYWVLKAIKGSQAKAVYLGLNTELSGWERLVREASATKDWVFQEYVITPSILIGKFSNDGRLVQEQRFVDLNPFYFGTRMGNVFARFSASELTPDLDNNGGYYPVVRV